MASNTPPTKNTAIEQQANNAKQIGQVFGDVIFQECSSKNGNYKRIPDYLWYLPDRAAQRKALREAIRKHEKNAKHRPLLCLVHGDEQERHLDFQDCFLKEELPRISKLYKGIESKYVAIGFKNIDELHDNILEKLWIKLFGDDEYPDALTFKTEMAQRLAEWTQPLILCIDIETQYCQSQNDIIKRGFLEFWANLPNPKNRLLIFLLFQYSQETKRGLALTRFFKPYLIQQKPSPIRQKFSEEIHQLEKEINLSTFVEKFRVGAVVLPELYPIDEAAAIDWLKNYCRNYFCNTRIDAAKTEIKNFYKNYPKGVPMGKLALTLKKIVTEVREA